MNIKNYHTCNSNALIIKLCAYKITLICKTISTHKKLLLKIDKSVTINFLLLMGTYNYAIDIIFLDVIPLTMNAYIYVMCCKLNCIFVSIFLITNLLPMLLLLYIGFEF